MLRQLFFGGRSSPQKRPKVRRQWELKLSDDSATFSELQGAITDIVSALDRKDPDTARERIEAIAPRLSKYPGSLKILLHVWLDLSWIDDYEGWRESHPAAFNRKLLENDAARELYFTSGAKEKMRRLLSWTM